jgi:hypothetical protein
MEEYKPQISLIIPKNKTNRLQFIITYKQFPSMLFGKNEFDKAPFFLAGDVEYS